MAGKIVYYLGSLARMGLQRRKFLISDVQRLASLCLYNCFSTNVYGLYARGDAEACLSSFHFYLRLWLPYLVKKCRTLKINIFRMCL